MNDKNDDVKKRTSVKKESSKKEGTPGRKRQNANPYENFFMIWNALRLHASRSEPLKAKEVYDVMVKIYGAEDCPTADTVRNFLRNLSSNPETLNSPLKIKCLAKIQDKFVDYKTYCEKKAKQKGRELTSQECPNRYFYLENPLNEGQWRALMDLIRFSPWISQQDSQDMLKNFRQLGGLPFSNEQSIHQFKRANQRQFEVISNIDRGIQCRKQVEISYGNHVLQNNQNGKLVPQLVEKEGNFKYLVSPLSMIWSNGSYYLVALYKERYIHLRVDRMIDVSKPKTSFEYPKDFVITEYRDSCPMMYGGEKKNVTFTCETSLLNRVMDTFGTNPRYFIKNGKLEVTVHATIDGVRLFTLLNIQQMEIIEPVSLREEIKVILEESLKKYK